MKDCPAFRLILGILNALDLFFEILHEVSRFISPGGAHTYLNEVNETKDVGIQSREDRGRELLKSQHKPVKVHTQMRHPLRGYGIEESSITIFHFQALAALAHCVRLDNVLGRSPPRNVHGDRLSILGPAFHPPENICQSIVDDRHELSHTSL